MINENKIEEIEADKAIIEESIDKLDYFPGSSETYDVATPRGKHIDLLIQRIKSDLYDLSEELSCEIDKLEE